MSTPPVNPYEAPRAAVFDPIPEHNEFSLIPNGQSVSAGQGITWITDAFGIFAKAWVMWAIFGLVLLIGNVLLSVIPIVGGLASMLLMPLLIGGLMLGCERLERNETMEFNQLFAALDQHTAQLLLVACLYFVGFLIVAMIVGLIAVLIFGVGAFAGMFTSEPSAIGAALLLPIILAGLLVLALAMPLVMAYWFAPALIVFHRLTAVDAMKQSFYGCLKNILPFLLYGIVMIVLSIMATIPLALGWIILVPWIVITMYTGYRAVFRRG
jgi:uncharacterized membrane protein